MTGSTDARTCSCPHGTPPPPPPPVHLVYALAYFRRSVVLVCARRCGRPTLDASLPILTTVLPSFRLTQVDKHKLKCRGCWVLTCVDCSKDFNGDEFRAHTSCISEAEKYQGKLYVAKAKVCVWVTATSRRCRLSLATFGCAPLNTRAVRAPGFEILPAAIVLGFHTLCTPCGARVLVNRRIRRSSLSRRSEKPPRRLDWHPESLLTCRYLACEVQLRPVGRTPRLCWCSPSFRTSHTSTRLHCACTFVIPYRVSHADRTGHCRVRQCATEGGAIQELLRQQPASA